MATLLAEAARLEGVPAVQEQVDSPSLLTELPEQLAGALQFVGAHLDAWDLCQARLASKLLARGLAAATRRLTVSVLAFERGPPAVLAATLARSAPAATDAVVRVKAGHAYNEDTFTVLFGALASKPRLQSLTIEEYSCPAASHLAHTGSSADFWAPHLAILTQQLTALCVSFCGTSVQLLPAHMQRICQLTGLQALSLTEHHPLRGDAVPISLLRATDALQQQGRRLGDRLAPVTALTRLTALTVYGDNDRATKNGAFDTLQAAQDVLGACTRLVRLDLRASPQDVMLYIDHEWLPASLVHLSLHGGMCVQFGEEECDEDTGVNYFIEPVVPLAASLVGLALPDMQLRDEEWRLLLHSRQLAMSLTSLHIGHGSFEHDLIKGLMEELLQPGSAGSRGHSSGVAGSGASAMAAAGGRTAGMAAGAAAGGSSSIVGHGVLPALRSLTVEVNDPPDLQGLLYFTQVETLVVSAASIWHDEDVFPMGDFDLGKLSILEQLTSLTLHLSYFNSVILDAAALAALSTGLIRLASLCFRGRMREREPMFQLPSSLTALTLLHNPLSVSSNGMAIVPLAALPTGLVHLTLLPSCMLRLEPYDQQLGCEYKPPQLQSISMGTNSVPAALSLCNKTLRALELIGVRPGDPAHAFDLTWVPGNLPHLTHLSLQNLEDEDCSYFCNLAAIGDLGSTLRSLSLHSSAQQNTVRHAYNHADIKFLAKLTTLTALELWVPVCIWGWQVVATLSRLPCLQCVSLDESTVPENVLQEVEHLVPRCETFAIMHTT